MTQTVIKIGSSVAVTIPKKSLKDLGITVGSKVHTEVDMDNKTFTIKPVATPSRDDEKIVKATKDFIRRYRHDLEILAK